MSHTDPELLQQFLREELPGDQMMMGGVVTFCIDAMDQTLSYSRSLPQTPATHLVFQRKDGHLSRLARCSNCQTWYPWTQSEEESWCDKQACYYNECENAFLQNLPVLLLWVRSFQAGNRHACEGGRGQGPAVA